MTVCDFKSNFSYRYCNVLRGHALSQKCSVYGANNNDKKSYKIEKLLQVIECHAALDPYKWCHLGNGRRSRRSYANQ